MLPFLAPYRLSQVAATAGYLPATVLWKAAVIAAGGTVSAAQMLAVNSVEWALKASGAWSLMDDMAFLAAENSTQTLVSFKQLRTATQASTPVFTANRYVTFDGVDDAFKTGFIASTMAVAMTGSEMQLGTYECTNVASARNSGGVVVGTNQRLELYPRTGGSNYQGNANCADISDSGATDSTGMTSVFRTAAPLFGFRKNGVLVSNQVPASSGTSLPNTEIFIGARNNGGAVTNPRACKIAFWYVGATLTSAQEVAVTAAIDNYRLSIALNTYVSSTGNDSTGDGSLAFPFLTWDYAYSVAPAGGTIWLDGATISPTVYKSATATTISKAITVRAINSRGAILAGVGTSRSITLSPTLGQAIVFRDLIIDAASNASGPAANCIDFSSQSTTYGFSAYNCQFKGWTAAANASAFALTNPSATFKGTIYLEDCDFVGADMRGAIYFSSFAAGGIETVRCTATLTDQNTSGFGVALVSATVAGVYARLDFTTYSTTLKAALASTGIHYGLNIVNIANARITGTTHEILGAPGSRQGYLDQIRTNAAGDATELDMSGAIIEVTTGRNTTNGGICFATGGDGVDRTKNVGPIVRNSHGIGDATSSAGGLHILFLCNATGDGVTPNATNVTGTTGGIGAIHKRSLNTVIGSGCDMTDMASAYRQAKGSTGCAYRGGTLTAHSGFAGIMTHVESDVDPGGTDSTGIIVEDTFCVNAGAASLIFVKVEASNTATFARSDYHNTSGTQNANPWTYQASNYATLALWQAGHEPTATGNVP